MAEEIATFPLNREDGMTSAAGQCSITSPGTNKKGERKMMNITPQEAQQIAEETYIFAFSMLENYKTMYAFSVNKDLPSFRATFNQFFHMRQLLGPEFTEVVGPNNDTLYSTAWLDLGTEAIVLSLPYIPDNRYYVIQIVDMYTFNVEYIGARTTGHQAAKYLFAGPGWDGPTPRGIDGLRPTEGRFLFLLGRTAVSGVKDVLAVNALQDQFTLTPLSAYLGEPAPEPAPAPDFPPYIPQQAASIEFVNYFNFLLGQLQPGPDERPLLEKWAQIGVQPGLPFDREALEPDVRQAVAEGVAAALEKIKAESLRVGRNINNWTLIGEGFGFRSMVGGKDLMRAAANMVGIYGNNPEEAYNFSAAKDGDGEPLDASKHNYVIHFESPPPVKAFWSVTMYKLPTPLFIVNPIKRYSIGDRTPGFEPNDDGSVTIYLQHELPGPEKESNWLPAPDGPFALALRIYWPDQDILDGKWEPAAIQKAG
ncbi:DUF1254 domain-containing protein [Chloroflexota bacterium]